MAKSKVIKVNKNATESVKKSTLKKVKEDGIVKNNILKKVKEVDVIGDKSKIEVYPGNLVSTANPESNGLLKEWNIKIVSWNVNGIRAIIKNKSLSYILEENADIVAIQETKCAEADFPEEAKNLKGYKSYRSSADKSGYAGTAIYSKVAPLTVTYGFGNPEHDGEGRVITAEYDRFYLVNAYVPNSGRGLPRLPYRQNQWDGALRAHVARLDSLKPVILCGDLNVAHTEIDLANPATNMRTAGFTREEREGMDTLLGETNLLDSLRVIYPERRRAYTFWSYMRAARASNIGWRLDYFLLSRRLIGHLCNQEIRSDVLGSDHCPIVLYLLL